MQTRKGIMRKRYRYRGFVILVDAIPVTVDDAGHDQAFERPRYLASVVLTTTLVTGYWETKFDAGASSGRLFRKTNDAFRGGYEAATAIIDEAIRAMGGSVTPAQRASRAPGALDDARVGRASEA
jgi:hypothetical protein